MRIARLLRQHEQDKGGGGLYHGLIRGEAGDPGVLPHFIGTLRTMRRFTPLLAGGGLLLAVALLPAEPPATPHKAYTEKIPGTDVSFDLVPVPAGSFLMGSSPNEPGRGADEGPQHEVKIAP